METKKIAVLVGSLRKESYNMKTAKALISLAPTSLQLEIVDIGNLPLYNEDLEADAPDAWTTFRDKIREADGLIFVTPEYNRSVPGVLKNAVDVGSRPSKNNVWTTKPAGVISVTPGKLGAFGANQHLRQSLSAVNVAIMPQPEMYIAGAAALLNEQNKFSDESTVELFKKFISRFEDWMARNPARK